jgi:hypothetical protein
MVKEQLLYIYLYTFQIVSYTIYILIALYIVGVYKDNAKQYLNVIDNYAKVIVSLFLMWKFNMFQKKIIFTDLDRSIVFQSGLFLFLTTSFNTFLISYVTKVKDIILYYIPIQQPKTN